MAALSGEYGIGAKPGIDAKYTRTASARHDRGWSVARMIDSRAAATRMVDMIVKVDRWVSRTLVASMATGRLGDLANRDHQCDKFAALSLANDLADRVRGGRANRYEMGVTVDIRRIVVGSALAAGVGVAGMIGAGTASAAPGISYDGGPGDPVGIGDNSATGAQANASNDNQALAISVFRPATATADGQNRSGNKVFALDGTAGFLKTDYIDPYTDDHDNRVVAIQRHRYRRTVSGPTVLAVRQQGFEQAAICHLRGWLPGVRTIVWRCLTFPLSCAVHRGSGLRTAARGKRRHL